MEIEQITIVGQGNVGTHLYKALISVSYDVDIINSRSLYNIRNNSELYILAVSDDSIDDVASKLSSVNGIIVHTSGSKSIDVLSKYSTKCGVFYPLQTFTKNVELNYSEIPFFIEGSDLEVVCALKKVANKISKLVYDADSERRKRLHVASVFACNYVNHMWTIADEILKNDGLSINVLYPLIEETINKIHKITPYESQTGPAVRQDMSVIESHLNFLSDNDDTYNIYKTLSNSIINKHK